MDHWKLDYDGTWAIGAAVGALLGAAIWRWWRQDRQPSHLLFPGVLNLAAVKENWRVRLAALPTWLQIASLVLLLIALINPRFLAQGFSDPGERQDEQPSRIQEVEFSTEGVALYLVLDCSSSMQQPVSGIGSRISRFEMLRALTRDFVNKRPRDMIGLIAFARTAQVLAPLTLDHQAILSQLMSLSPVSSPSEDGTAMGYALFKTVNLISAVKHYAQRVAANRSASYDIQSVAVIVVTDGIPSVHPEDASHELRAMSMEQGAQSAAAAGIKTYIINIEPLIGAPQHRRQLDHMRCAAELTGGAFYLATNPQQLEAIYEEIDRMERSALPQKRRSQAEAYPKQEGAVWREYALTPYLLLMAWLLLVVGLGLESTWLRRAF